MTVTVAASWPGSYAAPAAYTFPPPAARPVQVPVANTGGDWMLAIVTWRQMQAGQGITVSVADDAHNWWEPLGAPSGDSAAAGVTRTAIWAAPAARAAANVQVAANGPYQAMTVLILDVAGLLPWMAMTAAVTGYALAATSFPLSAGAPSAQALLIACGAGDNNSLSLSGPGAGWTALPAVTAANGTDHTSDIDMLSGWQVTTGATAATWTSGGSLDFSGIIAGVLVSAAAPAQPNPAWPVVISEIAPGAGVQTPPSQLSWTALSPRRLAMGVQQGRQYTLSALQAAQGTVTLDNPDGALIPPGTGPYAGIDSGTPFRQRTIVPAAASPHYVSFSGYLQRWPFALPGDMLRGETQATVTDIWGYGARTLNSMAREEMLLDAPYALWPMSDAAGSSGASNIAPGNSNPLVLTLSKYGAGGAVQAWGANTSSGLTGDASAKTVTSTTGKTGGTSGMFGQTLAGTSLTTSGYGYALVCQDANFPSVTGGVTIECWFECNTGGGTGFFAVTSGSLFTNNNATYANGDAVTLSGPALPGGFTANTVYYVISASGANFQLSATQGGSAITVTAGGTGFSQLTTPWNPVIVSARNVKGPVAEIDVRNSDGALLLLYQTAAGAVSTVVIDNSHDYRNVPGMTFVSLAFNRTSYRVIIGAFGAAAHSGTFSAQLAARFDELTLCGIQDRQVQGYAMSGYLALAAVCPLMLAPARAFAHYGTAAAGLGGEAACDRVERILEYAGLAGRRWIGQQVIPLEGDLTVSGQDIGSQAAASSAGNIASSTVPAMLYVAPTGDIVYQAKLYTWNQPVKWVLGDNLTAGILLDEAGGSILDEAGRPVLDEGAVTAGEIPFLAAQFATDYDPARIVDDIQLTQLDTQTVTVPSGVMSATTMQAVELAAQAKYGGQPYKQAGYLNADATSAYNAGGSMADLANWIANVYSKPANRVQAVTVNAAANAANASSSLAWQFWAGAATGDMVQVNVRLPTAATSPLISLAARITQTNRQMQFSQAGTVASVTCVLDFAPEYNALICDDATRGLLNGKNVLAWLADDYLADHAPEPAHMGC